MTAWEEHYNIISALHKCIRGSDPDAGSMARRMLEAGRTRLRGPPSRALRSEDAGLPIPTRCARDGGFATRSISWGCRKGHPLAQLVVYRRSREGHSIYTAYARASRDATEKPPYPVPLWIRNAPTKLMKIWATGGIEYAHD